MKRVLSIICLVALLSVTLLGVAYAAPPQQGGQEYVVHTNRYHCLDESELQDMMAERSQKFAAAGVCPDGIENMGQFTYLRKFGADFAIEMNRSVRAMIESWSNV